MKIITNLICFYFNLTWIKDNEIIPSRVMSTFELHYLRVYLYYDAIFIFISEHIQSRKFLQRIKQIAVLNYQDKIFKIIPITN